MVALKERAEDADGTKDCEDQCRLYVRSKEIPILPPIRLVLGSHWQDSQVWSPSREHDCVCGSVCVLVGSTGT